MMKKTAIFINASRGDTINEQALVEALQNKIHLVLVLMLIKRELWIQKNQLYTVYLIA